MYTLFVILVLLASILMILIVLIQNSKGGGLASSFASSNQIMGVRKTTDVLEKATWTLAAAMVVLSVFSAFFVPSTASESSVILQEATQQNATNPSTIPGFVPSATNNSDASQAPAASTTAPETTAPATQTPAAEAPAAAAPQKAN